MSRHRTGMRWQALVGILASIVLAGCSQLGGVSPVASPATHPGASARSTGAPRPEASAKPFEQLFSPPYGSRPPEGRRVRLEDASISVDGLVLTVRFVGSPGYRPSDPCTADYQPWLATNGDALDVTIVETASIGQNLPPNTACALIGYGYRFHLRLAAPFLGTTIKDAAGGTLWVRPPAGLVVPTRLPAGWSLQASFDEPRAEPSLWVRVYAAAPLVLPSSPFPEDVQPNEGPGRLFLYQSFGAPVSISVSEPTLVPVVVHGKSEVVQYAKAYGEMLLQYTIDGDGVALVARDQDFTPEQLAAVADGIVAAPSAASPPP